VEDDRGGGVGGPGFGMVAGGEEDHGPGDEGDRVPMMPLAGYERTYVCPVPKNLLFPPDLEHSQKQTISPCIGGFSAAKCKTR
jgi:hypothetical protein